MPVDLAPITGSEPGSFAHHVICERHPAIIKDLQVTYPYPRQQQAQLDELEHETLHGSITRLPDGAPGREYWETSGDGFYDRRWTDVPFLWAESYFYRRVLQAVQYFEPGPWHRLDPFRAKKTSELHDQRVTMLLEQLDATGPIAGADAFAVFLHGAVWGNKADLGFEMGLQAAGLTASHGPAPQLLVDDTSAAWTYLTEQGPRSIIVIADNAGPELICDLLLIDFLLRDPDRTVEIHLKPDPYYVSDATPADLLDALHLLANAGPAPRRVVARLADHMHSEALRLDTDAFYCKPERLANAPKDLHERYAAADLVIAKGDLNYRRLVGDAHHDPTTPFADACSGFPTRLLALRALKSDVIVGLDAHTLTAQDATNSRWRTNGSRAVIQTFTPESTR
jgi:uncharacterized protein with ATP-grasp and redox domains